MLNNNLILRSDSYKISHWRVYDEGTTSVYSYLESRGGRFSETVFFGLSYYLQEYLSRPITIDDIDEAESRFEKHFGNKAVFNREAWEYILTEHAGYLPLRIKAVPEGSVVPTRNVLMTIENTDPKCYWLTNYVESLLLKVWYPTSVSTLSREIKKVIYSYLEKTGDPTGLPFKLHDFGYRGVSSEESAAIGGASHLVNFMGTDTFVALEFIDHYYDMEMAGFSIPATEHSVMCQRGEEGELEMMERFLDAFGKGGGYPAIACVSDTYNIWRACKDYWGDKLKAKVVDLDSMLVVRPDSGDPVVVVVQVVETLNDAFGHTVNNKGFKVLNNVRVIQGDGINLESITAILEALTVRGWSADNIAFGMGGALLQSSVNRDTQKFAIKASSYVVNGERRDYQKNPVTDAGKRSKAGRLKLVQDENGVYTTVSEDDSRQDVLVTVFENGRLYNQSTFQEIRDRAAL